MLAEETFRSWDVEQRWLLPPSVQKLVQCGHVAHFVRENLDLGTIFSAYEEERGYRPTAMMVALLLYSYSRGVYILASDRAGLARRGSTSWPGL